MIMVDLFCPECDKREIDVFINSSKPLPMCDECDVEMKKLIAAVSFELKYDNRTDICDWDGNSSQYWNEIKKDGGDEPTNDKQKKWY
ncbi:MAG: hypothetical protein KAS32_03165 [Candidatus Peribacteraceae bacterium]|nr:hypothetical protein [Candidatus Peribacteraceae bacterium]